jgi:hypothetical protein
MSKEVSMHETFKNINFKPATQKVVDDANTIIAQYQAQGFTLTLRQLYYQFVARGLIANKQTEYKRLGSIVDDGRMSGQIDWDAIEDRTRHLRNYTMFASPAEAVRDAAKNYLENLWDDQPVYLEVWIEKDALLGVIEPACGRWRIPHFACRGYASQSEMYRAGERLRDRVDREQRVVILHLGDHDPSGIDMTRDNRDRLHMFATGEAFSDGDGPDPFYANAIEIRRIALNMSQVRQYNPPPNPAKMTDIRAAGYVAQHGTSSWELDALDPAVIDKLIDDEVQAEVDHYQWGISENREKLNRKRMREAATEIENEANDEED